MTVPLESHTIKPVVPSSFSPNFSSTLTVLEQACSLNRDFHNYPTLHSVASSGDMPQQQDNSSVGRENATRGIRYCTFTSEPLLKSDLVPQSTSAQLSSQSRAIRRSIPARLTATRATITYSYNTWNSTNTKASMDDCLVRLQSHSGTDLYKASLETTSVIQLPKSIRFWSWICGNIRMRRKGCK